jgi:hypothetical protein
LQGGDACRHWEQETNPTASISTHPSSLSTSVSPSFTYTSNKASHPADGSTLAYQCKLDGGAFGACAPSGKSYSGLADGQHTFSVEALFTAALGGGAHTSAPATYTWTQDTTPPAVGFTAGPAAGSVVVNADGTTSFGFSASDATSGPPSVQCKLDGAAFAPCTSATSETLGSIADGEHDFTVQATDGAGLTATNTIHWEQETPAMTVIDSGPSSGSAVIGGTSDFTFHSTKSDRPVVFQCALDGGPFAACSNASSEHLTNLSAGAHTLQVRALFTASLDGSQHAGPAVSRTWTVRYAPDTTITTGPSAGSRTSATSARFTFKSTARGTFRCAIDAKPPTACTSPKLLTRLGVGVHTFKVYAVDATGQADPTPATRTWDVVLLPVQVSRLWVVSSSATTLNRLVLSGAPRGATVSLICTGRGCPWHHKKLAVRGAKLALTKYFRGARLKPGVKLEIRVTKRGTTGFDVRYGIRSLKPPAQSVRAAYS